MLKKNKKVSYLRLMDQDKKIVYEGKLTSLNINEDLVLLKCIEYFDDDSPCYIHRSAAMKRLFIQLENYFKNQQQQFFIFDKLPKDIEEILKQEQTITYVEFYIF